MAAARGFLERVAGGLGGSQGEPQRSMRSSGGTPAAPPLLAATLGSLADVAQECLSQVRAHAESPATPVVFASCLPSMSQHVLTGR